MPFDTPRAEENVSFTMHLEERKCHLEEQACQKKERLQEAIHMASRERSYHQDEANAHAHNVENSHAHGYYRNPFNNNSLGGNYGNNMPPKSPRTNTRACLSPPRHSQSHHESEVNDKITSKDLMRFQQDEVSQRLILKALEKN